ncbi:MAG TPA: hypothetical protein VF339_08610 [Gammaproteobacteria bacterium]
MNTLQASVGAVIVAMAVAAPASAQWPSWPTPDVPRTADGAPDLDAPPPRMPNGKPDLSGLWENRRGGGPGRQAADTDENSPPVATFFNLGANMEGGQLPYQDWARQLRDERVANDMKDNPDAHCLPMGLMQLHMHPQPRKIIQTDDLIVILYEGNSGVRQIFLDGRPLPPPDVLPWWYGYSVGHWEGDELVVETVRLKDLGWLDVNGSPITDDGMMIERFRRPTYGSLEIDVTIHDEQAYTRPFTVRVNQRIMLDTELIEFVCNENEKSTQHFDP